MLAPWSQTFSFHREKQISIVFKMPSLRYFVIAAQTDWEQYWNVGTDYMWEMTTMAIQEISTLLIETKILADLNTANRDHCEGYKKYIWTAKLTRCFK